MLIDTDVLIWYLKGNKKARKALEGQQKIFLSVVTYIELVRGIRNKVELNCLRQTLHLWNAPILYLSEEISSKAMVYVEQHFLNHSLLLADALIGATAISYGMPILTANDKPYKVLPEIDVKKFRP